VTTQLTVRHGWLPDPERQRLADHTLEDVLSLPDDAPRVEVRHGVLAPVPRPSMHHQRAVSLLWQWLRQHAPADLQPATNVGIIAGHQATFEPDVVLLRRPLVRNHHFFDTRQVVLVVEVVSDDTKRRDRLEKPGEYAAAGIPHFWRVEPDPVHVHAYDLAAGRYQRVADSCDELVLTAPFDVRLPVRDVTP
jgi:Uma2 family endonuclease